MNRAQETTTESDAFDRRMLWMLLRHIRHTERVRVRIYKYKLNKNII